VVGRHRRRSSARRSGWPLAQPFNSLAPLTTGGSADAQDGAGDIIFVGVDSAPLEAIRVRSTATATITGTAVGRSVTGELGFLGGERDLRGNGTTPPNIQEFRLQQRRATTVRLPGYAGANNNNNDAVVAFIQAQNTVTAGNGAASNTVPTGGGFIGGAACTTPP
jgi:hypothetical protein